jgi:uncharacterized protein YacL
MHYLAEAAIAGVMLAAFGMIIWLILCAIFQWSLISVASVMITLSSLFIAGFLVSVIMHFSGAKVGYCAKLVGNKSKDFIKTYNETGGDISAAVSSAFSSKAE